MRKNHLLRANKILTILTAFLILLDVTVFRNHIFCVGILQTVNYRVLCSHKLDVFLFAGTACNIFILFLPYFAWIRIFQLFICSRKVGIHNRYQSSHKKKSRTERSGDIGGSSVSSWPPIHVLVIISFNHRRIIRQNMEAPILLKPNTWQRCRVRPQHFDNATFFRIYSRTRKDGPSNVLRIPCQPVIFALFLVHPIHWGVLVRS
jgi:hypothetical protein